MNHWQEMLTEFHRATGSTVGDTPAIRDVSLRMRLIWEEADELVVAVDMGELPEAIKELCDLLYVTVGTAVAWGIDLDPYFQAVHESNMSKLPLTKREDGKVLKGPNYRPPDIAGILEAKP